MLNRNFKKAVLFLMILTVSLHLVIAERITLNPSNSVVLNEKFPDNIYAPLESYVGLFAIGEGKSPARSLLYFDVSKIPELKGKHILNAHLVVNNNNPNDLNGINTNPYNIEIHRVQNSWDRPTWNTQPPFDTSAFASTTVSAKQEYSLKLSNDIIRTWLNQPEQNFGILIKGEDEDKTKSADGKILDSTSLIIEYEGINDCNQNAGVCRNTCGEDEAITQYSCGSGWFGFMDTKKCCAPKPAPPPLPPPPPHTPRVEDIDYNGDACITDDDNTIFLQRYNAVLTGGPYDGSVDLNKDIQVNHLDRSLFDGLFFANHIKSTGQCIGNAPLPNPPDANLAGDLTGDNCINDADILAFVEGYRQNTYTPQDLITIAQNLGKGTCNVADAPKQNPQQPALPILSESCQKITDDTKKSNDPNMAILTFGIANTGGKVLMTYTQDGRTREYRTENCDAVAVLKGTDIYLTAEKYEPYQFDKWSNGIQNPQNQFKIEQDVILLASFK